MTGRVHLARSAICFLVGFVLLLPGGGIIVSGWTGWTTGTPEEVFSPTAALVTPASGLFSRVTVPKSWTPRVRVDLAVTPGPRPVFVGLARAADLERYLGPTPVDEMSPAVAAGGPSHVLTRRGNGPPRALPPPAGQDFWIDQATGADARLIDWVTANDDLELVVMNADGTAGVDQQLARAQFYISARLLAIAMVFAGVLAIFFGVLYLRAGDSSEEAAPTGVDVDDLAPDRGVS